MSSESSDSSEREPRFIAKDKTVLYCTPGRFDGYDGERNSIITFMGNETGDIENVAINLKDTRKLSVQLIVSLATAGDDFAQRLLDIFPYDEKSGDEGQWYWPND